MSEFKVSKEKMISDLQADLKNAKIVYTSRINNINKSIRYWNGEAFGNEIDGKSKLVWKLIKKHGVTLVSNLVKPFIGSNEIIETEPVNVNDRMKSKIIEKLINYFFYKDFDYNKFLKTLAKIIAKEGTAIIRVGWQKVDKSKTVVLSEPPQELLLKFQQRGFIIKPLNEKTFAVTKPNIIYNRPTAKVLKNEFVYTQPNVSSIEESDFLIYEYETSLSELKSQPQLYDEEAVRLLEERIDNEKPIIPSTVIHNKESTTFEFDDKPRKKITIYEYWGWYDINNDGITEPIMCTFDSSHNIILKVKEKVFPFKKIPFIAVQCYDKEFDIWGESLSEMLLDEQKFITSIVRGIIDNLSNSNNGINFIKKNALDQTNYERLLKGLTNIIEVNTNEPIRNVIYNGNFNELPASVYNLLSFIDNQAETLSGVNKFMQGIIGPEIKSTASNFSATMTQSQIRLLDITTNISDGLKEMFFMWSQMCMEYLSDEEIEKITGINIPELKVKETRRLIEEFGIEELPDDTKQKAMQLIITEIEDMFNKKDIKYDIKVKVGTDGLKQIKIQQINMLMQQAGNLIQAGIVPQKALKLLFSKFAELMDFPDIAKETMKFEPKPDPMAEAMQKAELEEKAGKAEKEKALAANAYARTKNVDAKTQKDIKSTDADIANKYADVISKVKKGNQ